MIKLIVTDCNRVEPAIYDANVDGFRQAFYDFVEPADLEKLKTAIDEGVLYDSWSGKSTGVVERDRDGQQFWSRLLSMALNENQDWALAE